MRVVDLFSGLRGWSDPWQARGHEVITLDNEPSFGADLVMDIRDFARNPLTYLPWKPDVILASPPCEAFSVMTIGRNWTREHEPKTEKARLAWRFVSATLEVISVLEPTFWIIENPRAKLRRLMPDTDPLTGMPIMRRTVTYCQYGEQYMKPTDLWGGFPPSWEPRPMCRPRAPCHVSAARGSRTGIQGESARWTHPVLAAQSNNGFREDERSRRHAFEEAMAEKVAAMEAKPPTPRTKFKGGMIDTMSRFWSGSPERKTLTALRALIPEQLSIEICEAAERDLPHGREHDRERVLREA